MEDVQLLTLLLFGSFGCAEVGQRTFLLLPGVLDEFRVQILLTPLLWLLFLLLFQFFDTCTRQEIPE